MDFHFQKKVSLGIRSSLSEKINKCIHQTLKGISFNHYGVLDKPKCDHIFMFFNTKINVVFDKRHILNAKVMQIVHERIE